MRDTCKGSVSHLRLYLSCKIYKFFLKLVSLYYIEITGTRCETSRLRDQTSSSFWLKTVPDLHKIEFHFDFSLITIIRYGYVCLFLAYFSCIL